jgi:hypothetical protein
MPESALGEVPAAKVTEAMAWTSSPDGRTYEQPGMKQCLTNGVPTSLAWSKIACRTTDRRGCRSQQIVSGPASLGRF